MHTNVQTNKQTYVRTYYYSAYVADNWVLGSAEVRSFSVGLVNEKAKQAETQPQELEDPQHDQCGRSSSQGKQVS